MDILILNGVQGLEQVKHNKLELVKGTHRVILLYS
jgi:hypothetical protein